MILPVRYLEEKRQEAREAWQLATRAWDETEEVSNKAGHEYKDGNAVCGKQWVVV